MNLAMKKCAGRGDGTNSYYLPLNSWPSPQSDLFAQISPYVAKSSSRYFHVFLVSRFCS